MRQRVTNAATIRKIQAAIGTRGTVDYVSVRGGWGHVYHVRLTEDAEHYYRVSMEDWSVERYSRATFQLAPEEPR